MKHHKMLLLNNNTEAMMESENVWGIKEFEGDGVSCPIIPVNLPWYKKIVLTFFRFGICPTCITMSIGYSIKKKIVKVFRKSGAESTNHRS
ncbi:hypothetical protein CMU80_01680 [Elizabethkingia anophelis]|nr:hypothetical protein [Elizabethkingia anophelis]